MQASNIYENHQLDTKFRGSEKKRSFLIRIIRESFMEEKAMELRHGEGPVIS